VKALWKEFNVTNNKLINVSSQNFCQKNMFFLTFMSWPLEGVCGGVES
jgi:hypothetical protein